jgi:hypothetical protein
MKVTRALLVCTLIAVSVVGCGSDRPSDATRSVGQALLSGSTFEGNDGNLVVDGAGQTDWPNAPGFVRGLDLPSGSGDDAFGQGTKEDDTAVTIVNGSIPPNKNDLIRFYSGFETIGSSSFLYLAWIRAVNIGAANIDFELNQASQPSFALPAGANSVKVTLNRTVGDLLISYSFGGSGTPTIMARKWITSGTCDNGQAATSAGCWNVASNVSGAGPSAAEDRGQRGDGV